MIAQRVDEGVREAFLICLQLLVDIWPLAVAVMLVICIGYLRKQRARERL